MKAKEIMTKEVISLKPDDNALTALNTLTKMQISGLPVIDEKGRLAGMFTEKEIIAKILPSYVTSVGKFIYQENPKQVKQKVLNFGSLKVRDIMRREVISIDEDTTLCEIAHTMLVHKARRIPVLNKNKDIVGIVARQDVVKALFNE